MIVALLIIVFLVIVIIIIIVIVIIIIIVFISLIIIIITFISLIIIIITFIIIIVIALISLIIIIFKRITDRVSQGPKSVFHQISGFLDKTFGFGGQIFDFADYFSWYFIWILNINQGF